MNAPPAVGTVVLFLVSLVLSAFFSGCETGCMSFSRARLARGGQAGSGRARRLERMLRRIEQPILTCLIGTNLSNVLGSAVVTVALTTRYGERGEWYALGLVSVLVILFGEILPKVLYREDPEGMMLASTPALAVAMAVTAPVRVVLQAYTAVWHRLLPAPGERATLDRRSLAALLLTNTMPATGDRRFTRALARYLELEQRAVADIARPLPRLVAIDPETTVGACLALAARSGYSRLPVRDGGRLPAYVRVRDLLFLGRDRHDAPVPRRLWQPPLVVDGRLSPYEVFEEMRGQDRQLAVVTDPGGNPLGMITLENLIETVVGSIADEFDRPEAGPRKETT